MITCSYCGFTAKNTEELKLFKKNKQRPLGYTTICKKCNNEYNKKRRKALKNSKRDIPKKLVCKGCKKVFYGDSEIIDNFRKVKGNLSGFSTKCKKCLSKEAYLHKKDKTEEEYKKYLWEKENIALRCSCCGKLAYKGEDTSNFIIPTNPNVKSTRCKECNRRYFYFYKNPTHTEADYEEYKKNPLYIKKCYICGLEAYTEDDLIFFKKCKKNNLCKKCHNIQNEKYSKRDKNLGKTRKKNKITLKKTLESYIFFLKREKETPKWISNEELQKIKNLKEISIHLSTLTGVLYHIDHIYPKNSNYMCGLNLYSNLQVIPYNDNLSKGNRLGYLGQSNCTDLYRLLPSKPKSETVFKMLGCKMTWEEFLIYEKKYYKESLYE